MAVNCHVCGKDTLAAGALTRKSRKGHPARWSCPDHLDRVGCAIADCARTTRGRGDMGPEEWICPTHWRRHCPPRSLRRRAYLRYFRQAKRHGWSEELRRSFWRFWDLLVRLANQAEARGAFDMTEVNKLFGWDAEP